jgi:hypothetical protein
VSLARLLIEELEADASLASRWRAVFGLAPSMPATEPVAIYMRVKEYAARISVSERHAWDLVSRGLPCVGSGRGRRVDVGRADEWLRTRRDVVDDASEKDARRRARSTAKRGAR